MATSIVLIGPSGTGKTTIGGILSSRLGLPVAELDTLRWDYYAEIGYDREYGKRLREEQGFKALVDYWKPFDIHSVERVLKDYLSDHIIVFGAGHSVYEDDGSIVRVKRALAPFHNVVLVLPTADVEESAEILRDRLDALSPGLGTRVMDINRHFLRHSCNRELATLTVYTKGKTPEETGDEIIGKLKQ